VDTFVSGCEKEGYHVCQLLEEIENEKAKFIAFEVEPMYTKRESELLQMYMQQFGKLPGGGDDELDDLF
jgi:hypothetical protein